MESAKKEKLSELKIKEVTKKRFESTAFIFQNIPLWIASCVIGLLAVLYAEILHFGESTFLKIYAHNKAWVFVLAPVFFFLSYISVQKYSKYSNASGIPQVIASLSLPKKKSKKLIDQLLSVRIIFIKILSSFFMSLGGGVVGREGPTIQIAASVLHVVNKTIPDSWPKISQKLMIITGGAAGLAAAFNTPLGGIVFAIEELSKNHIKYLRTTVFSAVIIAGFTAQTILGPYLVFGFPKVDPDGWQFFLILLLVTLVCGIFGAYFGKIAFNVNSFKKKLSKKKQFIFGFLAVMAFATVVFYTDKDSVGAGNLLLDRLLFEADKKVEWYTIPARLFNGIISFTNGGAGGIFAPALSFGGSIGAFIGDLFTLKPRQINMLVLIGMVSFLTAFTRSPFTCAILVLEMTDRHSVIFYMLVAAWGANLIANRIDKKSFYEKTAETITEDLLTQLENKEKNKSKKIEENLA
ncbi:chloride channel protein [Faecalibacter bovis]|uniref:Chloride channel protein n=1 Tax=Faecalibacter bovis TaxID=2898187 RepID=A0ABX7XFL4_9FLAO|nr:chloride channel protein [Faecalibacter bovis]QTV06674.1 chloride channel protein [Faecalibacter bovis]